ncbi:flavin reductase (plasmid) [Methylobacterium currus]|uniref:flavin reductase n=1 Tax=Methylobacterium currus TaxID=2051553 RepID=UPI001E52BEED|nr:flavin reductase [Methylobacterium currus]UHC20070.1 flavin reductase [Methylobacterium currus]
MIDQSTYRDAMAGLAAAVNIITTDGEAGPAGCTVSAVCSVTDEPPTLLVCLNRSSANNEIIRRNGNLCVNVLSADQQAVAMQFATKGVSIAERLATANWSVMATGAPALDGAVCAIDCEVDSVTEVGTHTVFYCTVKAVRNRQDCDGLIYFGRGFHRVGPNAARPAEARA